MVISTTNLRTRIYSGNNFLVLKFLQLFAISVNCTQCTAKFLYLCHVGCDWRVTTGYKDTKDEAPRNGFFRLATCEGYCSRSNDFPSAGRVCKVTIFAQTRNGAANGVETEKWVLHCSSSALKFSRMKRISKMHFI